MKSTTRPKEVHLDDLALQLWVLRGAGVRIAKAGILTLNRDYVYRGGVYDVDELFTFHDLTSEARLRARRVGEKV